MARKRKLLYLLADGAHARFVEQSAETGAFITLSRLDGSDRLETLRVEQRDEPAGRTFESASSARHGVGREDAYRRAKEAFAADVAATLRAMLMRHAFVGVVLVAPPRLLQVLRDNLQGAAPIVAELGKDLTRTPDHDLGPWLSQLAFATSAQSA